MPLGNPSRPADFRSESSSEPAPEPTDLPPDTPDSPELRYREAQALAGRGEYGPARVILEDLDAGSIDSRLRALARNDLAAIAAIEGDLERARAGFAAALEMDPDCGPARSNLESLAGERPAAGRHSSDTPPAGMPASDRVRVAILSLLFNWPSTGGGTVHTAELARFLAEAGYEVRHLYARFDPWGIGQVTAPTPHPAEELAFADAEWTAAAIQDRFRRAIDEFDPDYTIVSDSWNFKPLLAEAVRPRPYLLRLQALECLCPLNNVRLLAGPDGPPRQCQLYQLARPDACSRCVRERGEYSGDLHRAERELSGVGSEHYREALFRAFAEAEAVLVVNPLIEAMVAPYARAVRVVTAGMDPARFPWPPPTGGLSPSTSGRTRVLFAGLTREWIKGFHVLREVCRRLWAWRKDFELVVTDDLPDGQADEFARYVGWQSQADLPQHLYAADVVAVPAVAQEALGRTAVEAMAAGKPVLASRIGGLPFTVADGETGLLFEAGDEEDLACKLSTLLDDESLRGRLGYAGRRKFEEHYAWPVVIEQHYRPLLVVGRAGRRSVSPGLAAPAIPPGLAESGGQPDSSVTLDHGSMVSDRTATCETRWTASSPGSLREQVIHASPPLVQVVGPTDGWVLERLARRLAAKLPYAGFVPWRPSPRLAGGLAYYVNYALFDRRTDLVDVGFFTHRDETVPGFLDRARRLDHCVCMARQYADWLKGQGVDGVTHLPMGFDFHRFAPRLVLGVVGRLDHPRKGRALVDQVRELPFADVFITGGDLPEAALRDWYQRLDYVLIPATAEGGPLSLLEGLAMGKPVIAPEEVGLVPEFGPSEWIHRYPAGDAQALLQLVTERYEVKRKGAELVRDRTWDAWAAAHDALFRRLLAAREVTVPAPALGFRFGVADELGLPPGRLTAADESGLDEASRLLFFGERDRARAALSRVATAHPEVERLLDSLLDGVAQSG